MCSTLLFWVSITLLTVEVMSDYSAKSGSSEDLFYGGYDSEYPMVTSIHWEPVSLEAVYTATVVVELFADNATTIRPSMHEIPENTSIDSIITLNEYTFSHGGLTTVIAYPTGEHSGMSEKSFI